MATTLLSGPEVDVPPGLWLGLGNLIHAKSLAGSHISLTPLGRYPPTFAATELPTLCDVLRIIPINVPLCFLEAKSEGPPLSSPSESGKSETELWLKDLLWLKIGEDGKEESSGGGPCWHSLKIWIVSVEEETLSRVDVVLKVML